MSILSWHSAIQHIPPTTGSEEAMAWLPFSTESLRTHAEDRSSTPTGNVTLGLVGWQQLAGGQLADVDVAWNPLAQDGPVAAKAISTVFRDDGDGIY